jgi:hypothetical protein
LNAGKPVSGADPVIDIPPEREQPLAHRVIRLAISR